jgi:transposase InsO family protein
MPTTSHARVSRCLETASPKLVSKLGLEWVDCYNTRRLLEPIGNVPPAEAEARYHARLDGRALAA